MADFQEIIDKYLIQIPIIQRDYAQGRNDAQVVEIRGLFLDAIYEKLCANEILHLDFVYGSIKEERYFVPLDGQQRLTTLFLLYWYFGAKEGIEISYLEGFTYETRASSRQFCNGLVNSQIDFSSYDVIDQIVDSSWFLPYWDYDPTIKSMLVMIDAIHKKFFDKLFYDRLKNITFEFFKLDEFGLDDDLYIKMNARGKPLTHFENFKAKFELFLEGVDDGLYNEFSQKIDKEWADYFWSYRDNNYLIDDAFMSYFYYISEMLHYRSHDSSVGDIESEFKIIKTIYSSIDNIKFLFKSLDRLPVTRKSFNEIFSHTSFEAGKTVLFDTNINLLDKVIENKKGAIINLQQKTILSVVVTYLVDRDVDKDLKHLVRIARNLLGRIRSLKQNQFTYTSTYDYGNLHKAIALFTSFIGKDIYKTLANEDIDVSGTAISKKTSLEQEINKAKLIVNDASFKDIIFELEDLEYLKGSIHNFLSDDLTRLASNLCALKKIFNTSDDALLIRAMLTSGDYKMHKGWSGGSSRYFFGKQGHWDIVFTSENRSHFNSFLVDYAANDNNLEQMIEKYLDNNSKYDWIYYFIKYEEMLDRESWFSKDNNVFVWYSDFNIEKMGGLNLNAFHISPYLRTVAIRTSIYCAPITGDYISSLNISNKLKRFYTAQDAWVIVFHEGLDETLKSKLVTNHALEHKEADVYILKPQEKDRVQVATEFLNELQA